MDRIEKINEQMKREIGQMLQEEFQDPRLTQVTITQVTVSRDLQYAKVRYSCWGSEKEHEDIRKSLELIPGHVRKLLSQRMRLRHMPEIEFVFDQSTEYSERIERALKEIEDMKNSSSKKEEGTP